MRIQTVLALTPDQPCGSGPELVRTPAVPPLVPEQIPLLRMLEIVRERVEAVHAGQRMLTAEVKAIRDNLPLQRRPLSHKTQDLHVRVIWARRNGLCPCCQTEPVCTQSGRLETAEFDHWYSRSQNRITQTWLVCHDCNRKLIDTDFKSIARSAFESYQMALKPFIGSRQALLFRSGVCA